MIYSVNDFRNPDYVVGFATSKSPMGPWKKFDKSPIIQKDMLGINGTGHGDVFIDKDGQMQYVLHTHFDGSTPQPRRTAIVKMDLKKDQKTDDTLIIYPINVSVFGKMIRGIY